MKGLAIGKKFFVIALGALMTISCIACGQNNTSASTENHLETAIAEGITFKPCEFNDPLVHIEE